MSATDVVDVLAPRGLPDGRSVQIRGRRYPVLLPRVTDPRLHVAAVIVTVQVLGQVVLGFDVSIAQILIAIGTAGVLELVLVAWSRQEIAWPASALLTGNGVALILRTPGTVHGDWWSLNGWPIFVACSGIALLSKYAITVRGRHLFNPSNFGLVVIFLTFGARYADPQDLWWGPWSPALALTLAVILVGGITLARRLQLFTVALTFWITFALGIGVLAAGGHAITARWHVGPLEDWSYWLVFVTSPEIVIFVFFMITDPRTAPIGRVARAAYAAGVGVLAAFLAGFQHTEFATKVSLLAALTIVCGLRPSLERWLADDRFAGGDNAVLVPTRGAGGRLRPTASGLALLVVLAAASVAVISVAGSSTRQIRAVVAPTVDAAVDGGRPAIHLPAGAVPKLTVDPELSDIDGGVSTAEARQIARDLIEDLVIAGDAVQRGDADLASVATFGDQLDTIEGQIRAQARAEQVAAPTYRIDEGRIVLLKDPVDPQSVPQLGVMVRGEINVVTRAGRVESRVLDQQSVPYRAVYLITEVGGHYLIGAQLPIETPMVVGGARLGSS